MKFSSNIAMMRPQPTPRLVKTAVEPQTVSGNPYQQYRLKNIQARDVEAMSIVIGQRALHTNNRRPSSRAALLLLRFGAGGQSFFPILLTPTRIS